MMDEYTDRIDMPLSDASSLLHWVEDLEADLQCQSIDGTPLDATLYLKGATDLRQALSRSISALYNLQAVRFREIRGADRPSATVDRSSLANLQDL